MAKEAKARIKINKLLEDSGWRLLDSSDGKANVLFENNVKITKEGIDVLGENFEKTSNGFIDFLLLDDRGFPLVVLEAKSDDKNPLVGKEQARKYAKTVNCRFIKWRSPLFLGCLEWQSYYCNSFTNAGIIQTV